MRVQIWQQGALSPVVLDDATLVVVSLPDGTPVSVSWQQTAKDGTSGILTSHAVERDFDAVVQRLGLPVFSRIPVVAAM